MHYYGIDVGMRKVAVASVTATGNPFFCASFQLKAGEQRSRELRDLYWWIKNVDIQFPDKVVVEAPVVAGPRNLQTSLQLAMSIGAVVTGIPYLVNVQLVEPSKWKMITGNGNSTKEEARAWLAKEWPELETVCDGNQDRIDAMCMAVWNLKMGARYAEAADQ